MSVSPDKRLTRLELKFGDVNWKRATIKQYELEKELAVWRVFINGYTKSGFVVFDGDLLPKEEVLERLSELKPEVTAEKEVTVAELVESSMSWNNVFGRARG
ncbi:DUF3213 domain-containing protein [Thermococcus sp.]